MELAGDEIGLGYRLGGEGYSLSSSCDLAFTYICTRFYLKQRWVRDSDPISDASYFHPTTSEDFKARKAAHNRQVTFDFKNNAFHYDQSPIYFVFNALNRNVLNIPFAVTRSATVRSSGA